ncbi:MAG: 2,3-bisphosphoglycerate-independent phosphoglycerate mutase, partial [Flavobacteriales bacterium]|nr:2,3-bisphosphoglycerate-independent phosphoglycerate mutase [Flavobacteriales bacterium]
VSAAHDLGYSMVVIADHGNADFAVNSDGSPNTAHSLNPVPVFVHGVKKDQLNSGILANVAPTILKLMGVSKPSEMTHDALF